MENRQKEKITKSRERVKKFGEVYTPGWMVQKMCNMLEDEMVVQSVGEEQCWSLRVVLEISLWKS